MSRERTRISTATLNNYGDIVLAPGTINVYGVYINHKVDEQTTGNLYMCSMSEAIVPIVPTEQEPTKLEERRSFSPNYDSIFNVINAKSFTNNGNVYSAEIELISNCL